MGVKISQLDIETISEGTDYVEISREIEEPTSSGSDGTYETSRVLIGSMAEMDFWRGTQAEYDALGSYEERKIYFIKEEESS